MKPIAIILAVLLWWGIGIVLLIRDATKDCDIKYSEIIAVLAIGLCYPLHYIVEYLDNHFKTDNIIIKKLDNKILFHRRDK